MKEENKKNEKLIEESEAFDGGEDKKAKFSAGKMSEENSSATVRNTINVKNIENIENIETIEEVENTRNKRLGMILDFLPHMLVGIISLVALAGLIYIVWTSSKQGANSTEAARNLITFLVAVITIVIALILTLMAFFSTSPDLKERFSMGKEILTILIGVLGTIVGFYYGSAPKEVNITKNEPDPTVAVSPSPSPSPTPNPVTTTSAAVGDLVGKSGR